MTYASNTSVSVEKSRYEIEVMCKKKLGATRFASGWSPKGAALAFEAKGRHVKFILPLPVIEDFKTTQTGRERNSTKLEKQHEQALRSRWRSLALTIKAKIEAIESGISDFDAEFLSFIVMPGGETVGEIVGPKIIEAYKSGVAPPLMLGMGG